MTTVPAAVTAAPPHYASRMRVFFAGYFIFGGVAVPFFPVWLDARGLSDVEIASIVAIPTIVRVLLTPFAGMFADRAPNRRFAAVTFAVPAAVIFLLAWPATTYWPILLFAGAAFAIWGLALPVAEALALTGVRRFGLDYGRMRLGGSVSFILANLAAGGLLGLFNADAIFWLMAASLAVSVVVSLGLPVTPPALRAVDDTARPVPRPLRFLLAHPGFLALIVVGGLIQASHAVLYSFGSIYWRELGFGGLEIGAFWAIGIVFEVALFMWSGPMVRLFGPFGLLALGGGAATVRWVVMAESPGFIGFAALQALHGLTFGAVYLGNQHAIARAVPEEVTASAQGLFAMVAGILLAATTALAGPLYQSFGKDAFLFMAPIPVVALAILGVYRRFARPEPQA
ncbi:MAG: MFS transporter [Bauldia sp.]|nr:MAG: MFS transporter [Bauldia sp.]